MADELFGVTLLYGQGYREEQVCQKDIEKNKEKYSQSYDSIETKGEKILEYHIKKIIYTISPSQSIQTLKVLYKNRNNGQIEELLDTKVSYTEQNNDKDKLSSIEFEPLLSSSGSISGSGVSSPSFIIIDIIASCFESSLYNFDLYASFASSLLFIALFMI